MALAAVEFKNGKAKFDKEIADLAKVTKTGVAPAVEAAKSSKDIEKAAAAWDTAVKGKDPKKIREALADLLTASKIYRGKLNAANTKIQAAAKKETNKKVQEALEDAGGSLGNLSGVAYTIEESAQDVVNKLGDATGEKIRATTYLADWKSAKKMFETLTGKKKPSASFLGAFRKSSGLEKAIGAMDAASKKNDVTAFAKAYYKFDTEADAYLALCKKSAGVDVAKDDDKIDEEAMDAADYNTALENLLKGLNGIRKDAADLFE
ncbi:MAG TPA: hypothetical protein VGE52_01015 [Pirellulales bacterium]